MSVIKNTIISAILREPYMHFLFIGLLLYLYYQNFHTPSTAPTKQSIVISSKEITDINQSSSKRWGRSLHYSELDVLVEASYLDEILLNEAISLELEREDKEIRERLIRQMRQILAPSIAEPSEELLRKYYQEHKDDYGITTKISFAHIYLQDLAQIDTQEFVEILNLKDIKPESASTYGDNFTADNKLQNNHIESMTQRQISELFGKYFAQQLWRLSRHKWHGAIRSKYGYHILYITDKLSTKLHLFDEVEDRVYSDYMAEQRAAALQSAYEKLSTQYQLERRE